MDYSAAVLAGGKSKRFGSDKALYLYKDKPLIKWVLDSFIDSNDIFIVANQDYPTFDTKIYSDIIASSGPLSGIYTGLSHAKNDWLAVAACDMPLLTVKYWQGLFRYTKGYQAVVITTEHGLEPLAALYHISILEIVKSQIESSEYSVQKLLRRIKLNSLDISEINQDLKVLSNFNYLKDFKNL